MAKKKASSAADILGKPRTAPGVTNKCSVCEKPVPVDRIKALIDLGVNPTQWTHTKCSQVKKIKGIYLGEVGTSEIKLCNKIYNDSVRSVFRHAEADSDSDPDHKD